MMDAVVHVRVPCSMLEYQQGKPLDPIARGDQRALGLRRPIEEGMELRPFFARFGKGEALLVAVHPILPFPHAVR
jgi:hypothetical protein